MRFILFICIIGILSCQNKKEPKLDPNDPCTKYMTLSGTYETAVHEGSVVWNGQLTGTVEFIGVDFNEMTCTYSIADCETGAISMICDGADFPTKLLIEAPNQIKLNSLIYTKL